MTRECRRSRPEGRARIRLLLFDVDGVLTDGRILLHADGSESKAFSIRDGTGIVWAQRAGLAIGLLSARHSAATAARAAQLGIRIVRQQAGDKLRRCTANSLDEGLSDAEVAFMGDDLLDLPVLARVGLSAAPADAAPDVLARVDWVSQPRGRRRRRPRTHRTAAARAGALGRPARGYLGGERD